jgi:hypothetical protein
MVMAFLLKVFFRGRKENPGMRIYQLKKSSLANEFAV